MGIKDILTWIIPGAQRLQLASRLRCGMLAVGKMALVNVIWLLAPGVAAEVVSDSTSIRFHQSQSGLDLELGDNRAELERMSEFLERYDSDSSGCALRTIRVVGGASPEGTIGINERLSHRRANSIFDYFKERFAMPSYPTESQFLGRDWRGLYSLVVNDAAVPYREEVLEVLRPAASTDNLSAEQSNELLTALKRLRGGRPYNYLYTRLFPALRESRLYIEFDRPEPIVEPVVPADTIPVEIEEPTPVITETTVDISIESQECSPFYMGLKSNLLYDALAIPSIGAEFYLGKNWSIVGSWSYGWWDKDRTHRYWRAYGGDIAVRKWFGSAAEKKPLTGHHLGLYAGVFTYDFEFGGVGHMGGRPGHSLWDRCLFTAGVEYGYSLPIARRLNLDFTIGLGYVTGKVVKYHPKNDKYVWDSTRKIHTVLPTKIEISLVWLIGCNNFNRK